MKTRSSLSFTVVSLRRATLGLIMSGSLATPALGETVVDLVPQTLQYFDVGTYYQDVLITIRNIGNAPWRIAPAVMRMRVAGMETSGYIHGKTPDGRWQLGRQIDPGAEGLIKARIRANRLRHCLSNSVEIDLSREHQTGGDAVLANDFRYLVANNLRAVRICVGGPIISAQPRAGDSDTLDDQ